MKKTLASFLLTITAATLVLCSFSPLVEAKTAVDGYSDALREIRAQRTMAESRVKRIKSKFKPTSLEYNEAEKLFSDAHAQFDGYVTTIASMIRDGEKKPNFDSISKDAIEANKKFINYVDNITNVAPTNFTIDPVDVSLKIITWVKKNKQDKRNEKAANFEKNTTWREWSNIS